MVGRTAEGERENKPDYTHNTLMIQILQKGAGQTQTDHADI